MVYYDGDKAYFASRILMRRNTTRAFSCLFLFIEALYEDEELNEKIDTREKKQNVKWCEEIP